MQKDNSQGQLFEDSQVLDQPKLLDSVMGVVGDFSQKVAFFKSCHDLPVRYPLNFRIIQVDIVLSDEHRGQIAIHHQEVKLVLVA